MKINYKELANLLVNHLCNIDGVPETCNTLLSYGYTEKDLKLLGFSAESIKEGKEIKW